MSCPFSPMAQIPVSREAGGTRLSRPFSPIGTDPRFAGGGWTRLSRPFTPIGTDPRFAGGGRDALVASVLSNGTDPRFAGGGWARDVPAPPRRVAVERRSEKEVFLRSAINHAETLRTQRNPGLHHVANPSTCPVAASCDPPVGGVPCNFTFQRRAFGTYECRFDLQNNDPADCKGKSTVPVPKQDIVLYDPYHHMYGFPGINLLSRHMK